MLFSLAMLPSVALLIFIYKMDKKESEPKKLLWSLFLWGVVSIIPIIIVETILDLIVEQITVNGSVFYALLDGFIVAGMTEEVFKYLFLKRKTWNSEHFDCMFDGTVYAVFVSLGFASVENVMYVTSDGIGLAFLRMFTSIPGHLCFAIFMGYYYSKARLAINNGDKVLSKKYRRLSVLVPIILHGFYDFLIMIDMEVAGDGITTIALLAWLVYIIVLFIRSFRMVFIASKNDEYIVRHNEAWQCPCGNVCFNNFCAICGHPHPSTAFTEPPFTVSGTVNNP